MDDTAASVDSSIPVDPVELRKLSAAQLLDIYRRLKRQRYSNTGHLKQIADIMHEKTAAQPAVWHQCDYDLILK